MLSVTLGKAVAECFWALALGKATISRSASVPLVVPPSGPNWFRPRSIAQAWIRPTFHLWTQIPEGFVPAGGDWFQAVEGVELSKQARLESRLALTECLFHAGLVFIPCWPNPGGMDLFLGRSERNERGLVTCWADHQKGKGWQERRDLRAAYYKVRIRNYY